MRLRRLRLQNFRQHADTEIDFGDGITGIIGANGSGKTTLLEAIAWAIYGTQAVRGDKEGVRNLRAKPRASVKVELDFELGKHTYHVERGLHTAALLRDGQPIANALKEVTDQLEGVLGMRHDEFFNTYFTGQKELAVMAQLGKTERAAFLSRVLGYDRLRIAQERVRETKNALSAELKGLETGLPDRAGLEAERRAAEEKLARARRGTADAERARQSAAQRFAAEEPRWTDWVAKRERTLALDGDRRMAEQAVDAARREFERLDKELAEALAAREQLKKLASELEPIALLKREQAELERLLQEETARRADQAQLEELTRVRGTLAARLTELEGAPAALAETEGEQARAAERVAQAERAAEELRTAWVRDRQDVETKLQAHRDEYRDLKQQRDVIAGLGPAGICPTCKRPLGEEYEEVIAVLDRQLEQIAFNGNFFRQRFDQLAAEPEALLAAERERDAAAAVARAVSERAGTLRAQVQEAERARVERADGERRAAELERQIAARPAGYDAARHDLVRARLTRLDPIALEAAALETRASRAEPLVTEAEIAERSLSQREAQAKALAAAVADQGFSEEEFKAAKDRHDKASLDLRAAELAVAETRGDLTAAEGTVREVERREEERAGQIG